MTSPAGIQIGWVHSWAMMKFEKCAMHKPYVFLLDESVLNPVGKSSVNPHSFVNSKTRWCWFWWHFWRKVSFALSWHPDSNYKSRRFLHLTVRPICFAAEDPGERTLSFYTLRAWLVQSWEKHSFVECTSTASFDIVAGSIRKFCRWSAGLFGVSRTWV